MTRVLKANPDDSWDAGQPVTPKNKIRAKDHCWILSSTTTDEISLDLAVDEVLKRFRPIASRLSALAERPKIYLSCSVFVDSESSRPAIAFNAEAIRFLGEIGAEVGVDLRFA